MAATNVQLVVTYDMPTTKTKAGGIYRGNGTPDFVAPKGSEYINLDGDGTGNRKYINTDGSTTWTAFTTAA